MTIDRPPAPADPWKDVTKLQASLVRDRYEWVYFASDVDAARLATEQQHQQALSEREQIIRDTLWMAGRYADGRRSYAVGMYNDARVKAEMLGCANEAKPAIDGMMPEWATLRERLDESEQHTARLRAALEHVKEFVWHRATCDANFDGQPCSCGLDAALAASPAPKET